MPSSYLIKKWTLELEEARTAYAKAMATLDRSMVLTGGQLSDKSRLDFVHPKHALSIVEYWQKRITDLESKLNPETNRRGYVPVGYAK